MMNTSTPTLPPLCGDIDIRIAADGTWFHEGSPIGRKELVRLFASVLVRDDNGDYLLKTPVEEARIVVEDAPFLAITLETTGSGVDQTIALTTNVGDRVTLDGAHPLHLTTDPATDTPKPYVTVRDGLDAKLVRSVYYELVELGTEETVAGEALFGVWSAGCFFSLSPGTDETEQAPC